MKLQINSLLALYSVLDFASDPQRHIPAAEIAARYGVSAHHLAKVLAELARAGVVESARGVGGGYRFAANPKRLTLLDVISLFEDISSPVREGDGTPADSAIGTVLGEIDQMARATFSSVTVATMLRLVEREAAAPAASRKGRG